MAEIVLGIATSHSPQLSVHWTKWSLLREKDETDPRLDYSALVRRAQQKRPDLQQELTKEKFQQRYEACQRAIQALGETLKQESPEELKKEGIPVAAELNSSTARR